MRGEAIGRGIQRGFIGSHSDIGGGYVSGDLSDVSFNWIVQDAVKSGVVIDSWASIGHAEWGVVADPLLHRVDARATWRESDQEFCLRRNNKVWPFIDCQRQREAEVGGMDWKKTLPFIHFRVEVKDRDHTSYVVG